MKSLGEKVLNKELKNIEFDEEYVTIEDKNSTEKISIEEFSKKCIEFSINSCGFNITTKQCKSGFKTHLHDCVGYQSYAVTEAGTKKELISSTIEKAIIAGAKRAILVRNFINKTA